MRVQWLRARRRGRSHLALFLEVSERLLELQLVTSDGLQRLQILD